MPRAWAPGADLLPLQVEVQRHEVGDAKNLRALEDENRRLKQLVADQQLDDQALKAALGKKC